MNYETKAIYLTGKPGAGKTTFGRKLSEQFGWKYLEVDALGKAMEGVYVDIWDVVALLKPFFGGVVIIDHLSSIVPENREKLGAENEIMVFIEHENWGERYERVYPGFPYPKKGDKKYRVWVEPFTKGKICNNTLYIRSDKDERLVIEKLKEWVLK